MLGKSVCILLSGKAGVGKTTTANKIVKYATSLGYISTKASFATKVKEVATTGFHWDGEKNELGRRLLQEVGQTGRNYREDIWVESLLEEILPTMIYYPYEFVVIDDWRFPNELYRVMRDPLYSAYPVRIEAPEREMLKGKPSYYDVSETSLDDMVSFYKIIDNSGNEKILDDQVFELVSGILDKEKHFGGRR